MKYTLYKWGALWCAPCRNVSKFIHDFDDIIKVKEIDIDLVDPIALQVWQIRTIPVLIICDNNGHELWRHVGLITKENLEAKIKEYANN